MSSTQLTSFLFLFVTSSLLPAVANAQIKSPNAHVDYSVELEPQILFDFIGHDAFGLGVRAGIEVADPAFIPSINNTIAIDVGLGVMDRDTCRGWNNGRWNNGNNNYYYNGWNNCPGTTWIGVPVDLQWNFWFHKNWSAFGEAGLVLEHWSGWEANGFEQDGDFDVDPHFGVGGRYIFNSGTMGLVMRINSMAHSFGFAFYL